MWALALTGFAPASQEPALREPRPPAPGDYPAAPWPGRPRTPVLPAGVRWPSAVLDTLRRAAARGPNFAGDQTIVHVRGIDCAPSAPATCEDAFLVVSARTGRVVVGPAEARGAMRYAPESRLLAVAAPVPSPGRTRCAGCTAAFYVWDGNALRLVPPELWVPAAPLTPEAHRLVLHARRDEASTRRGGLAPGVVRPSWDRLVVLAHDGARRVYADSAAGAIVPRLHVFRGTLRSLGAHVVETTYMPEGGAFTLVDAHTARETPLDTMPVPSPDGRRFATATADLVAGHRPNRVRVYRRTPRGPVVEAELAPRDWGATRPVWSDGRTLRLTRVAIDLRHRPARERSTPMTLVRGADGTWRVRPGG